LTKINLRVAYLNTVEPAYNDIALCDTSSIPSFCGTR